ncbi:MAG TPA: allantoicase [Blastocatellia bacterium]|nr:allantoicase [Blastocatellia bacterium]
MDFTELIDLVSERLGGAVLAANDEFFAPKEGLLKADAPVFIEGRYTDRGKWMDGWETRRKRGANLEDDADWCLIRLGLPGLIRGVVVDTSFFRGNYPAHCALDACALDGQPEAEYLLSSAVRWTEVLPKSALQGDSRNRFAILTDERATHLRLRIYPDGGVARLRVYGEVLPDWERLVRRNSEIDLAAVENGGMVVAASDMFFGHRHNLIMPGRALNMGDGWETRRRRGPGHDWCIIRLGRRGIIERIEVDTAWFRGNYPESCSLEACDSPDGADPAAMEWRELLPRTKLQGHTRHHFEDEIARTVSATHLRFNIYPDGGVSRLRVYGRVTQ